MAVLEGTPFGVVLTAAGAAELAIRSAQNNRPRGYQTRAYFDANVHWAEDSFDGEGVESVVQEELPNVFWLLDDDVVELCAVPETVKGGRLVDGEAAVQEEASAPGYYLTDSGTLTGHGSLRTSRRV